MRRIALAILTVSMCISALAQTESQHLTFKGVPIDGTLEQFVAQMNQMGFKGSVGNDHSALLVGDFAGFKGCVVRVETLSRSDIVCTIKVSFPSTKWERWEESYDCYVRLKDLLTIKYGKPRESIEQFDKPYSAKSVNDKEHEMMMGRGTYKTVYKTKLGEIVLLINTSCITELIYSDSVNSKVLNAAALADL